MTNDAKMNPEIKAEWTAALRSGEYAQGREVLHDEDQNTFCCLGVLCDIAIKKGLDITSHSSPRDGRPVTYYNWDPVYLPTDVAVWAGIENTNPHNPDVKNNRGDYVSVASLNDDGYSFAEIADMIDGSL